MRRYFPLFFIIRRIQQPVIDQIPVDGPERIRTRIISQFFFRRGRVQREIRKEDTF